jgi:hypothetical protein
MRNFVVHPIGGDFVDFYKILLQLKEQGYKKIEIEIETGNCNLIK